MSGVVDKHGFVKEGNLLTVFIPATKRAFVFRVEARNNKGYEYLPYGPLPLTQGTQLPTYDGTTVAVPEDGVLPARAYTPTGITFRLEDPSVYDTTDMWYLSKDNRDRLFHVKLGLSPAFLRVDVQLPIGVSPTRFQKNRVVLGVDRDFGFSREGIEVIHIPELRIGYRFGNDTNLDVYTYASFMYAEYEVSIPKSPETIFDVLTNRIPSYWVTMPVQIYDPSFRAALIGNYGIEGFPLFPSWLENEAISTYESLLSEVKL